MIAALFDAAKRGRVPAAVEALSMAGEMGNVFPPILSVRELRTIRRTNHLWRAFVAYHNAADAANWHAQNPVESQLVFRILKERAHASKS